LACPPENLEPTVRHTSFFLKTLDITLKICYRPGIEFDMGSVKHQGRGAPHIQETTRRGLKDPNCPAQKEEDIPMFKSLWHDEDGLTTVEYALLLALVAIAAIAAWTTLGKKVNNAVSNASSAITQ